MSEQPAPHDAFGPTAREIAVEQAGGIAAGMTLRDYFAGQALTGLAATASGKWADYARGAYAIADAMLEARKADPNA